MRYRWQAIHISGFVWHFMIEIENGNVCVSQWLYYQVINQAVNQLTNQSINQYGNHLHSGFIWFGHSGGFFQIHPNSSLKSEKMSARESKAQMKSTTTTTSHQQQLQVINNNYKSSTTPPALNPWVPSFLLTMLKLRIPRLSLASITFRGARVKYSRVRL